MLGMFWVEKRKVVVPRQLPGHPLKHRAIPSGAAPPIRPVINRRFQATIISVLLATIFWGILSVASAAPAGLKILHGHVPAVVEQLQPKGTLASTNRLHLAIGLPLRNTNELDDFLARVYDPVSTNFHQYLTPVQFTEQFGPADMDYASVKEFAKQNHLTIEATYQNKLLLDVSGSVEDIERAFHVTMHVYQHPTEARDFYAPDTEPSVSAELPIADISGLNNYVRPHPKSVARSAGIQNNVASGSGSGPGGAYMGNDFRAAYLPGVSLTGAGQAVGLLEFDGYYSRDISRYEASAGLPAVPLQTVLLNGFNGKPTTGPNSGDSEVSLDIELAISMAPGLSRVVVFEGGPNGNPNDILNRMAASNQVLQLSCSWGWGGGPSSTTDNIFKEMAAQGQSFFCASGDNDAYTSGSSSVNGVDNPSLENAPSSSPYLTSVGGTTLSTTGPGGSWSSETVWNWGLDDHSYVGSGGGISSYYAIPSWQANVNMTANGGSTANRNVPDVAMIADNVYADYGDGSGAALGGTSCATPLWAALTALMNEQSLAGGGAAVGFINPAIYAIGQGADYGGSFHDISTGNNTWKSSPNDFYAVGGYDLCTGWGTPNGQALINAVTGLPDSLGVPPTIGSSPVSNALITNVWQLSLARTFPRLRDTGTAFITFSNDSSFAGYGLSTHSAGMFTLSGTWAVGASGKVTGTFSESPLSDSGSITGKANTKEVLLSLAGSDGTYKLNGKPVSTGDLPDFSGSWDIILRAPHTNIVSSISVTSTNGYPGLFEIAGPGLSGEAIETTKGGLTMYIDSASLGDTATLAGKFNAVSQAANLSGKDENNGGVRLKLTRP